MNKQTIEKLNTAKVGDVIEMKKWLITVIESDICEGCYRNDKYCRFNLCSMYSTIDKLPHIFTRERKRDY